MWTPWILNKPKSTKNRRKGLKIKVSAISIKMITSQPAIRELWNSKILWATNKKWEMVLMYRFYDFREKSSCLSLQMSSRHLGLGLISSFSFKGELSGSSLLCLLLWVFLSTSTGQELVFQSMNPTTPLISLWAPWVNQILI